MDFNLSREEVFFRESSHAFLARLCPPSIPRAVAYGRPEPPADVWRGLAGGGWLGLAVPERFGGGGGSLVSLGLFTHEAGRVLLPTAYRTTVLAALAVDRLGSEAQKAAHLPGLASGAVLGGMALEPPGSSRLRLDRHRARFRVTGSQPLVANAGAAGRLLVFARHPDGGAVALLLSPGAPGVSLRRQAALGGEPVYQLSLAGIEIDPADVLGEPRDAQQRDEAVERWLDAALAVVSLEMAGGAGRMVELTARHVRERRQFGRALGTFQAVQHHLADMAIAVDAARAAGLHAAWTAAHHSVAARETSIAKLWAGRAYKSVSVMAHQLHGGSGYVREADLHLWSERALADSLALGTAEYHLERIWRALAGNPTRIRD